MTQPIVQDPAHEPVYSAVLERYGAIAATFETSADSCCDDSCNPTTLYDVDVSNLPVSVTGLSLGCGDPVALAALAPGQRVLDLGSGGGIDCFLAAERVGPTGHVIGVDMTPAMIEQAERNRLKLGRDNVAFRYGQIEALPVDDGAVDVIISNCVVNLSPDKTAVFREAYRVLAPGGRLAISDMVTRGRLDDAQKSDLKAWSACVAGAESVSEINAMLIEAGFAEISIRDRTDPDIELAGVAYAGAPALLSARITARKPSKQ